MEKIVSNGDRDCTVILDGTECSVKFDRCFRAFSVQNNSTSDVFVSIHQGANAGDDGVMRIKSGASACYPHMRTDVDTVYLNGTGEIQVHGQNTDNNSFRNAPVYSGGGVTENSNPVIMDGLQGGVPFSEIIMSGDDIIGNELTLTASGKNLMPYPYANTTKTTNGITFTDNGDGTVTANGTATADATFYFANRSKLAVKGNYYLSGCPIGGSGSAYDIVLATFDVNNATVDVYNDVGNGRAVTISKNAQTANIYIRIRSGQTVDNMTFYPQLELGATATEYVPPTGKSYEITPDSNPYIVPNDIRQQDGHNVISVSDGTLSVTGVRKNAALKRVWDKIDEITTAVIVSNGESE